MENQVKKKVVFNKIACLAAFMIVSMQETVSAATVYFDDFSGLSGTDLNGVAPDTRPGSETWASTTGTPAPWKADGSKASSGSEVALLPFTPAVNKVYTLTLDVNPDDGTAGWFSVGFTQRGDTTQHWLSGDPSGLNAAAWMLNKGYDDSAPETEVQTFLGLVTGGGQSHNQEEQGLVELKVVLNTSAALWTVEWFFNGTSIRGPVAYTTNPTINYVGFSAWEQFGVVDNFQLDEADPAPPTGVVITKDPAFTSSVMIQDFNGAADPAYHYRGGLEFDSIGGGMGKYRYFVSTTNKEAYCHFDSSTTFDPFVYESIRIRMNSDRSDGEDGDVDVYAFPVQGNGLVRFHNYPDGTTLREASWDLGSTSPTTAFDGTGIRVDPFNYTNNVGTDYWNVDYIIADAGGQSRGAEFDSQGDLERYLFRDIINTSIVDSVLSGTTTSVDSQIHLHTGIGIDANTYKYVEFRVKATAGTEIKWFWKTALTGYEGVVLEPAVSNDGQWHTYFLDMKGEAGWLGGLTYNRFDPTDAAGVSFEVDYVRFLSKRPPAPVFGYEKWAARWGGVDIGAETNDYDLDGLSNLYEFGLDGDPTNALDQGTSPTFGVAEVDGTNLFGYVHPQRSDPDSGLTYSLALATDLVAGNWTTNTGYVIVGTNVTSGTLDFVTNATDTVESQKYIRLIIE